MDAFAISPRWFAAVFLALCFYSGLLVFISAKKEMGANNMAPIELDFYSGPAPADLQPFTKPAGGKLQRSAEKTEFSKPASTSKAVAAQTGISTDYSKDSTTEILSSKGNSTDESSAGSTGIGDAFGFGQLDDKDFEPVFVKPDYPAKALNANIEGVVVTEVIIDTSGYVTEYAIKECKGHPDFANEIRKVVRRWRYPPPRVHGHPVMARGLHTVEFKIEYSD